MLPAAVADTVTSVIRQVVERGTAVNARIGRPVAGKTGTGQAWRDAWFVGYTPQMSTAVWVGFPERQRSMVPPTSRIRVTGGSWPAQIWQLYMTKALASLPIVDFARPGSLSAGAATSTTTSSTLPEIDRDSIAMPNVVGAPEEDAAAMLIRQGFEVARRRAYNEEYPPGFVVASDPRAGTMLSKGSYVVITVGNGPFPATVPNVLGLSEIDARQYITNAGLTPKILREAESQSDSAATRKGVAWKQSPLAGSGVERGSTVSVWVNPP